MRSRVLRGDGARSIAGSGSRREAVGILLVRETERL